MDESWTLGELVAAATDRVAALPAPKNGQVRAVPDERTIRYYTAIGLLDRPLAMRGRTAMYGARHLAQVVAIKRLQGAGHSLADIRDMWPTLDDATLSRMTGIAIAGRPRAARKEFWKRAAAAAPTAPALLQASGAALDAHPGIELRLSITPGLVLAIALGEAAPQLTSADVRALRAAAAPLVTELANRGLIAQRLGTLEEP